MKLNKNTNTEQRSDFPVLEPGEYDFEVENAKYKTSASGNPMWEVELKFEQPTDGPDVKVWEYFVETAEDWANDKFVNFFNCIGITFDDTDDMKKAIGEVGRAKVKVEKGKNGYSDRNKVTYWIPKEKPKAKKKSTVPEPDDLPF